MHGIQRPFSHRQFAPIAAAIVPTTESPKTTTKKTSIIKFSSNPNLQQAQQQILDIISTSSGRGKTGMPPDQQSIFNDALSQLETAQKGFISDPTSSKNLPLLDGRWRLLYTTRPGTASPIQRTFTGIDSFSVYQEIETSTSSYLRVNNIVDFGPSVGYLKVEAEASVDSRPIPGFVPRQKEGLPFGILGRSNTDPPVKKNIRVDFGFDKAAFYFKSLPFTIPYPVPFKLLGDERKGWIDVTYLSKDGDFRISRGNKGTVFVLVKDASPKERLLALLLSNQQGGKRDDAAVLAAAEALMAEGSPRQGRSPAKNNPLAAGKWRLRWTQQGKRANPLQKALADKVGNWQIISGDGSELENRVALLPQVTVRAMAVCEPDSITRTGVDIEKVLLEIGPWKVPLDVKTDGRGFIDWLYLDEDVRITKGNKGSLFIHTKDADER